MKRTMKILSAATVLAVLSSTTWAKLPAPSDEAKAKAAEAAAKAAWVGKVGAYKLCLAQDRVVAHYKKAPAPTQVKAANASAKGVSAVAAAPGACVDPGQFVYPPVASNQAVAPAAVAVAAPVAVAPAKKP